MAVILLPLLAVLAMLAAVSPAVAHGGLANYTVGDTWYRGFDPNEPHDEQTNQPWTVQRQWNTIDPIFSIADPFLACNNPGTPPLSAIPIRAGQNLTAVYWFWLHPVGPMSVWLAPCGDTPCAEVNVNEAGWFKIWEAGLLEGPNLAEGVWYQKQFQRWDGSPALWPVAIPAGLKAGNYIVRHEILSIHVGMRPQFYPQCAHLVVEGGGDALPPPGEFWKRFPGVYEEGDGSIFIDIYREEYKNRTDYVVPGGPIWDGFKTS